MPDWANISVGVATVVGLVYVVRVLRTMQQDVLSFFGNHMTQVTLSLTNVALNLSTLNERVDRLHDDNVMAASTLKSADKQVTRKVEEQNMGAVLKRIENLEKEKANG